MKRQTTKLVIDPVCKMELSADQAAAIMKFNRRTYYFCHVACLRLFEADPLAYLDETRTAADATSREAESIELGRAPSRNGKRNKDSSS